VKRKSSLRVTQAAVQSPGSALELEPMNSSVDYYLLPVRGEASFRNQIFSS